MIDECRKGSPRKFSVEELTDRMFLPMLVEATRVLEDGVVTDVRDVDLGLILGIGFPPFRGGPFRYVDATGAAEIVRRLVYYEARYGRRFAPAKGLVALAENGGQFYDTRPGREHEPRRVVA